MKINELSKTQLQALVRLRDARIEKLKEQVESLKKEKETILMCNETLRETLDIVTGIMNESGELVDTMTKKEMNND